MVMKLVKLHKLKTNMTGWKMDPCSIGDISGQIVDVPLSC